MSAVCKRVVLVRDGVAGRAGRRGEGGGRVWLSVQTTNSRWLYSNHGLIRVPQQPTLMPGGDDLTQLIFQETAPVAVCERGRKEDGSGKRTPFHRKSATPRTGKAWQVSWPYSLYPYSLGHPANKPRWSVKHNPARTLYSLWSPSVWPNGADSGFWATPRG